MRPDTGVMLTAFHCTNDKCHHCAKGFFHQQSGAVWVNDWLFKFRGSCFFYHFDIISASLPPVTDSPGHWACWLWHGKVRCGLYNDMPGAQCAETSCTEALRLGSFSGQKSHRIALLHQEVTWLTTEVHISGEPILFCPTWPYLSTVS